MKKAIAVLFTLFLFSPMVAAAEQPVDTQTAVDMAEVTAETAETPEEPTETPVTLEDLLAPEAVPAQGPQGPNCCRLLEQQCEANCSQTGVFEFSCNTDSCTSSCICNIG